MINFLKFTKLYVIISLLVIGVGVYAIFSQGLQFAIDFTGGSALEYETSQAVSEDAISTYLSENKIEVQELTVTDTGVALRSSPMDEIQEAGLRKVLSTEGQKITVRQFDTVGPSLGQETIEKTTVASIVAILGILLYVSFTFKKASYGLAAVGAMLHDLLVLFGMYALLGRFGAEIDALFITAVLTTLSFSVHDTIVVFDKIREYRRTSGLSIEILANKALTETMTRSLNNSITIILMLVPLTLMGGETIQYFAAALLIGTITGTYSSPFVATPLLVFLQKKMK